jgi:hypothetical protein
MEYLELSHLTQFAISWYTVTFKALRPISRVDFGLTETYKQSGLQGAQKLHRYRAQKLHTRRIAINATRVLSQPISHIVSPD